MKEYYCLFIFLILIYVTISVIYGVLYTQYVRKKGPYFGKMTAIIPGTYITRFFFGKDFIEKNFFSDFFRLLSDFWQNDG